MKVFKRILAHMLFNRKERAIIMNALYFSDYTYRRRGKVDQAVSVRIVINDVEKVLASKRKYTEKEVDAIIEELIKEACEKSESIVSKVAKQEFENGYKEGLKKSPYYTCNDEKAENFDILLKKGLIIDREKCDACEFKNECEFFKLVFGGVETKGEQPVEGEPKSEENRPEELTKEEKKAEPQVLSEEEKVEE